MGSAKCTSCCQSIFWPLILIQAFSPVLGNNPYGMYFKPAWTRVLQIWNNVSHGVSWETITSYYPWWSQNTVIILPLIFKCIFRSLTIRKGYFSCKGLPLFGVSDLFPINTKARWSQYMIFLGLYNHSNGILRLAMWKLFLAITIKKQLSMLLGHFSPRFLLTAHLLSLWSPEF